MNYAPFRKFADEPNGPKRRKQGTKGFGRLNKPTSLYEIGAGQIANHNAARCAPFTIKQQKSGQEINCVNHFSLADNALTGCFSDKIEFFLFTVDRFRLRGEHHISSELVNSVMARRACRIRIRDRAGTITYPARDLAKPEIEAGGQALDECEIARMQCVRIRETETGVIQ